MAHPADLLQSALQRADTNAMPDLTGAELDRFDASDGDLRDLRAACSRWVGATLRGADLRGADLRGATLIDPDLREADLRGADLRGAVLLRPRLEGANLEGARFDRGLLIDGLDLPVLPDFTDPPPPSGSDLLPVEPAQREAAVLALADALRRMEGWREGAGDQALRSAESALERATQLAPRWFRPFWTLGELYLRLRDPDAAAWAFEQALARHGGDVYAGLQASSLYLQRQRPEAALRVLDALEQGGGRLQEVHQRLIATHRISAVLACGEHAQGSALLDAALARWPTDAELHVRASELAFRAGRLHEALRLLQVAIAAAPERSDLPLYLADLCLNGLDMPSDALTLALDAAQRLPDDPRPRELLQASALRLVARRIVRATAPLPAEPTPLWLLERAGLSPDVRDPGDLPTSARIALSHGHSAEAASLAARLLTDLDAPEAARVEAACLFAIATPADALADALRPFAAAPGVQALGPWLLGASGGAPPGEETPPTAPPLRELAEAILREASRRLPFDAEAPFEAALTPLGTLHVAHADGAVLHAAPSAEHAALLVAARPGLSAPIRLRPSLLIALETPDASAAQHLAPLSSLRPTLLGLLAMPATPMPAFETLRHFGRLLARSFDGQLRGLPAGDALAGSWASAAPSGALVRPLPAPRGARTHPATAALFTAALAAAATPVAALTGHLLLPISWRRSIRDALGGEDARPHCAAAGLLVMAQAVRAVELLRAATPLFGPLANAAAHQLLTRANLALEGLARGELLPPASTP